VRKEEKFHGVYLFRNPARNARIKQVSSKQK